MAKNSCRPVKSAEMGEASYFHNNMQKRSSQSNSESDLMNGQEHAAACNHACSWDRFMGITHYYSILSSVGIGLFLPSALIGRFVSVIGSTIVPRNCAKHAALDPEVWYPIITLLPGFEPQ